ncbi:hypothetical protein CEY12_10090 [Chryseobacterium sp. T16E-39]|uniref:hypothetical protein n=1 Tax=Chryseobacterium sp. T16E-39 TaxID=2015076 RepID=UPI000B5B0F8C|nr:hypothetical protein [Chryseobacterium sp. T16E-39]ASK30436.1 hypothetical protein CEY12_10090 [Chryseobacterium sp. T16E-39]
MRKRYIVSKWFLLGLLSWLTIILLRRNGIIIPWINDYFTDVLTIPMYAYLIQYVMNKILGFQWKPNLKFIISSAIYLSVLFEIVCPLISDQFTRDIFDILSYFVGGMGYYWFKNKKERSRQLFSKCI